MSAIHIDPEGGAIQIELAHGESISLDGLEQETTVLRGEQRALFVAAAEAETLGKMIDHILAKVPIKPESADALRAVRPRLDQLFQD